MTDMNSEASLLIAHKKNTVNLELIEASFPKYFAYIKKYI
jgi:hypothetical protein